MRGARQGLLFLLTLALLSAPFLVWWKAQALTDWYQLRNYSPPQTVSILSTEDAMTPYARHVFYVNHPDIESNAGQFRQDCGTAEKTIILGCYHSDQNGIFLYDVTDPRLAGVEQVTAAHEMLHAAYDRLSSKDRDYVDGLLQDYYKNQLKDQRILDTIDSYRQTEPNDVVNEMHSVFGTEVGNLPAQLENYYKRYFSDRSSVVNFANSYENEFTSREDQIKTYKAQLDQLKASINSQEADLSAQLQQINSDRARLDSQRSSGQIAEYNAGVGAFNQEVNQYNSSVGTLRRTISQYNQLVDDYNSVAKELASLAQSLDSSLQTQRTQ
jgi:flagellar capping protein FliD